MVYPGSDFEIARAMPSKPHAAPAKLTAAQLAELDVIDLCSSSSEDEVSAADPHAPLEALVEPLCLQPAHCADEEAGVGPRGAGIGLIVVCFLVLCIALHFCPCRSRRTRTPSSFN